jgi:hypothetical protein
MVELTFTIDDAIVSMLENPATNAFGRLIYKHNQMQYQENKELYK